MKQINNGFKEYYYLKENGYLYNSDKNKTMAPDRSHMYCLKTEDNKRKKIAQKTLYKLVYNANYCNDNIKDLDNEQWKEIEGTEGLYKVSNKGRVKSLQGYNAIILKPYITKSGYYKIDLKVDGIRQNKFLHRIVAAAFLAPPQKIDMQLHHKDFNKNNNTADNLCWLTIAEHRKIHCEKNKEIKLNGR